jgi:hypothetical protein
MKTKKPTIIFIPTYIGSLKYYERVVERLRNRYDIAYVIIQPYKDKREGMIEYCQKRNLSFYNLTESKSVAPKVRFLFFTALRKRYLHAKQCEALLSRVRPEKIVATKSTFPHDTILKEANRQNIETTVLRWAFSADGVDKVDRSKTSEKEKRRSSLLVFLKRQYFGLLHVITALLDRSFREPRYAFTPAIPKKVGAFTNKEAEYLAHIYPKEIIQVVESIDIQSAYELRRKYESDEIFKTKLLQKYGFSLHRIKIFLVPYRFYDNRGISDLGMSCDEHLAYYREILEILRKAFPTEQADIFLKLHPSEENIYSSYEALDVRIFGDESSIEELVCISDLFVASPQTNVNYLVLGSGVQAIFINLSHRPHLEAYIENFRIQNVVTEKEDFVNCVQKFKNGTLKKQYDNKNVELRSLDKAVTFITT